MILQTCLWLNGKDKQEDKSEQSPKQQMCFFHGNTALWKKKKETQIVDKGTQQFLNTAFH